MEHRPLGRSGLTIPKLMFGGNVFGWTADETASFKLLDALVEAGLTAIDTADVYSVFVEGHQGGESETMIGKWLKSRGGREKLIIASKVGMRMGSGDEGLSKAWIAQAAENSLRRLGTDYIDLYQAHRDDPSVPLAETLGAFASLMVQGKVRAIGASNYTAPRLREALHVSERHGLPRYESLQPHYNLMQRRDFETELEPVCREAGLAVIPYFSLAGGFLTGKYRSLADAAGRARERIVKQYLDGRGEPVLKALDETAARLSATPTQVALAWLMAKPTVTAPIASATSVEQLADLVKATQLVLDREAMEMLDAASA